MDTEAQVKSNNANWGLLPIDVKDIVRRREWDNLPSLKARLTGSKDFPIKIGLKPPNGSSALSDMAHFQRFFEEWNSFPHQDLVRWSSKNYRDLLHQRIPIAIEINSVQDLIRFLGRDALSRSKSWERNMKPLLKVDESLYPKLVKYIEVIEKLSLIDVDLLAKVLPQLKSGMGSGQYLRALPLIGVDTKFLENHYFLIEELLDTLHSGTVFGSGGLSSWLGCATTPKDWLTIRALCKNSLAALGGIPILRIPTNILKEYELQASNILVVENLQSGLALPEMNDTIAVIGGGKNVSWMDNIWLRKKRVGYWGDIDTWGFSILSDARERANNIESIMMDLETMKIHEDRIVQEPDPVKAIPSSLTEEEVMVFNTLISGSESYRLEQERLSSDYISCTLAEWLSI